jgi:soluble lytic murein transglycosylase-like protein
MMRAICVTLIVLGFTACSRSGSNVGAADRPPTRTEIWLAIQPMAERYRISPAFIYALVAAESNFDPAARNGTARGLLQIKPAAWHAVSTAPYEPTVWNWRRNLEAGVDYLAYSRAYLHKKTTFSYPLLLAAFHYGLEYVEERNFNVGSIPVPDSPIYRQLWSGNLTPVPPP